MEEVTQVITRAQEALRRGDKRDDVYHEVVRYAAMNGYNRYFLWQMVQGVA